MFSSENEADKKEYRTDSCNVPPFFEVNFCPNWGVGLYTRACPGRENLIAQK